MQFAWLGRLLPKSLRLRLLGQWNKLLQWEHYLREKRFYGQFVKRGDLVFDVGANKGYKTAAFLSLGARVVAVEPNPVCTQVITEKNARAITTGTLHVECAAAASHPGEMALTMFDSAADMVSGSPEFLKYARTVGYVEVRSVTAAVVTVDQLIERFGRPLFLKIDAEGMDAEVLRGLTLRPRYLSFEYNAAATHREHMAMLQGIAAPRISRGQLDRRDFTQVPVRLMG